MSTKGPITLLIGAVCLVVSQIPAASSRSAPCVRQFGHRVKECLEPYWSAAALLNPAGARLDVSDVLAEHLCLQFEIALVCLHTALTECPSHSNVRYVQSKLGSDWAIQIRDLCVGQSGRATNRVPGNELELVQVEDLLESSSELLQEYLTDFEDEMDDEDDSVFGANGQQIVVVVPREEERGHFYSDLALGVRKKAKLRARHSYGKSRPVDVTVYNIFEEIHETQTNSAGRIGVYGITLQIWIVFSLCFAGHSLT